MSAAYAQEIRSYLLGRLDRYHATESIGQMHRAESRAERLMDWWMFEGKRYSGLPGSLCHSFAGVLRAARAALITLNPRHTLSSVPEGEVDWLASALRSLSSPTPTFVVRASGFGLLEDERAALLGWLGWIGLCWQRYTDLVAVPEGAPAVVPWHQAEDIPPSLLTFSEPLLRRWAHTAKRSRWPILRNVVAESLRCVLEPAEIDQLPLPTEHATLFELVCIARILRTIAPSPSRIRWLSSALTRNEIRIPGVCCQYQRNFPYSQVLDAAFPATEIRAALGRLSVSVPVEADALFSFDAPIHGFQGLLLECKSGKQDHHAAVEQLRCYRAASRASLPGPVLVLGVIERPDYKVSEQAQVQALQHDLKTPAASDVWAFCSISTLIPTLEACGLGAQASLSVAS